MYLASDVGLPSPCPFNILEVRMLYSQGFPGPTWKEHSGMDFPDGLSSVLESVILFIASPHCCALRAISMTVNHSFLPSFPVL